MWEELKGPVLSYRPLEAFAAGDYFKMTQEERNARVYQMVEMARLRPKAVSAYAWTITDPDTVHFVAEFSDGSILDPLAGNGYWGFLLKQLGVDVKSSDLSPYNNIWAKGLWANVEELDGVKAAELHSKDRTLLLAWPPYERPIGLDIVRVFPGDRIIYIGEGKGGCCGSDELFDELATWEQVTFHRPVQFEGIRDYVEVYERTKQ